MVPTSSVAQLVMSQAKCSRAAVSRPVLPVKAVIQTDVLGILNFGMSTSGVMCCKDTVSQSQCYIKSLADPKSMPSALFSTASQQGGGGGGGGAQQWEMLSKGKQVQAADLQSQDILSAIISHFEDAGLEAGLRGAPLQ